MSKNQLNIGISHITPTEFHKGFDNPTHRALITDLGK